MGILILIVIIGYLICFCFDIYEKAIQKEKEKLILQLKLKEIREDLAEAVICKNWEDVRWCINAIDVILSIDLKN